MPENFAKRFGSQVFNGYSFFSFQYSFRKACRLLLNTEDLRMNNTKLKDLIALKIFYKKDCIKPINREIRRGQIAADGPPRMEETS